MLHTSVIKAASNQSLVQVSTISAPQFRKARVFIFFPTLQKKRRHMAVGNLTGISNGNSNRLCFSGPVI